MKSMSLTLILATALLLPSLGHARKRVETRCMLAVERQEDGLSSDSQASSEDKEDLIKQVAGDELILTKEEAAEVLTLLRRSDTLAFTFGNDAGGWLTIADAKTCKVLLTLQIQEN